MSTPDDESQAVPVTEDASAQNTERARCIAVDFDGVIADYDGWVGASNFGACRKDVRIALHTLKDEGWKIVIHTTRGADDIAEYLQLNDIPYDEINWNSSYETKGAKPVATVYWDDRSLRYSGDASSDLQSIREFRTWSGRR